MNDRYPPTGAAVFVDGTGRRRRLLRAAGGVVGTLGFALAVTMVAGLFAPTPLPEAGWPEDSPTRPTARPAQDGPTRTAQRTPGPDAAQTPTGERPARAASRTPQAPASPRPGATASRERSDRPSPSSGRTSPAEPESSSPEPEEQLTGTDGPGRELAGSSEGTMPGQDAQDIGTDVGTGE
ncbi:hypothetical protein ACFFMN_01390 [Planobispora siamensis]|uniref:Uncharacterized protein n=1 Tax=Planobispora siamensis TaxID=936338 RepID=A0A8J3WLU2_9ACTN|nr:hypothetical protein [Planobispora siamensis]GIH95674.1 hypothetical protein Psi01_63040 [Planobispora siamensis]